MLKEIHEQPDALRETIGERLAGGEVVLDMGLTDAQLLGVERISITACGTACHAGMIGRLLIEQWAKLPVDIEYASEFRYRFPVLDDRTLAISVSQSGETADTIAAQRVARDGGALTLAICNQMGSQLTREADGTLYTRSGREICVAATKTFTSQVHGVHAVRPAPRRAARHAPARARRRAAGRHRPAARSLRPSSWPTTRRSGRRRS